MAGTDTVKIATAFTNSVFNNYCNNVGGMSYGYTLSANVTDWQVYRGMYQFSRLGIADAYQPSGTDIIGKDTSDSGVVTLSERIVSSNITTGLEFTFSYSGATIKDMKVTVRRVDTAKPTVKSAAPMATTAYKKGDVAYISVIYNEPINSISGTPKLTLSSKLSEYFESPTYVSNGTGTNALVFKVKAKKDITADEIQNKVNLYLAFPVSGVGGSFSTNIGTISATVKDIMGN